MSSLPATGGRDVHTVRFPVGRPPATVDVLIVGAGPVGLAAATELTSRGIRVAVVDRARTATLVRAGRDGPHPSRGRALPPLGPAPAHPGRLDLPPEWNRGTRLVTSLMRP